MRKTDGKECFGRKMAMQMIVTVLDDYITSLGLVCSLIMILGRPISLDDPWNESIWNYTFVPVPIVPVLLATHVIIPNGTMD